MSKKEYFDFDEEAMYSYIEKKYENIAEEIDTEKYTVMIFRCEDIIKNILKYAYETYDVNSDRMKCFITSLIPDIEEEEIDKFITY